MALEQAAHLGDAGAQCTITKGETRFVFIKIYFPIVHTFSAPGTRVYKFNL